MSLTTRDLASRSAPRPVVNLGRKVLRRIQEGDFFRSSTTEGFLVAASKGKIKYLERFLREGFDVNSKDSGGRTPLYFAVAGGHRAAVEFLLARGADPNIQTQNANLTNPIHVALVDGRLDIAEMLVSAGANVNALTSQGISPAQVVMRYEAGGLPPRKAMERREKSVQFLLDNGANISFRTHDGSTLLHYASSMGHLEVVKVLVEVGMPLGVKNNEGKTAFDVAKTDQIKSYLRKVEEFRQSAREVNFTRGRILRESGNLVPAH